MRIFEHRHHSEAEQIDFQNAHVGAIVFVPLHDDAAGHGRGLERHDAVELSLADHHAAGMLAQMPRQILNGDVQLEEFPDARILQIEAGLAEVALGCVLRVLPFECPDQARRAAQASSSSKPSTLPISRAAERPR